MLCLYACVEIDNSIGTNFLPKDQLYKTYAIEVPITDIRMAYPDSLSGLSSTRITVGAVRDDEFGLSTRASAFFVACNRKATQMRFASTVFDKYTARLSSIDNYADMDRFLDGLNLKVEFPAFAKSKDGIKCTEAEWDSSAPYLVPQLKALVSRYSKLGENAFYKYYLPVDDTVSKALEALE